MDTTIQNNAAFQPGKIGNLELKNRLIVPAMVTNTCTADGLPTERFMQYHEEKARGGWGLIITEDYAVTPYAGGFRELPGLWSDEQIPAHTEFVERIHKLGAKICCQIYHAGRQTNSKINGVQCMAPSPYKDPPSFENPKEMTKQDIQEVIQAYADAAARAKQCGFDAVEVHGAHGYLINQFNSPYSNKRADEYGGTTWNRTRFGREVIEAVRRAVGEDFPVLFKLTVSEYVGGGLSINEGREIARIYGREPIDAITISQGVNATEWAVIPPAHVPVIGFIQNVKACREVIHDIPVIAIGRIVNFDVANNVIEDGICDFVAMGRASLADPLAPKKYLEGNRDDIQLCIGCVQGCLGNLRKNIPIQCLVNPRTVKEYCTDLSVTDQPKKVAVAGGGIAGCEAAMTAAMKGHHVTLYEASDHLGGQWKLAAVPSAKQDFTTLLVWLQRQLDKLNVEIRLNTPFTPETAAETKPDVIICASGSTERMLKGKGLEGEHIFKAQEILSGRKNTTGNKVVVIGGGSVGVETAVHMAQDFKDVSILEVRDRISADGEFSNNYFMFRLMDEYKVKSYAKAFFESFEDGVVTFRQNDEVKKIYDVTDIVISVGSVPNADLAEKLKSAGYDVRTVGDASQVKPGLKNIEEGYFLGLSI
ncbi:MAG: FAD-dependent oxidoreductase [Solobacterium sp.]|nr:FAD-dependent oxidoreductase [Solobacterium sp.]